MRRRLTCLPWIALLSACGPTAAARDVGSDVSIDAGVDLGADVGVDAPDAGPWQPSFTPRVVFEDRTVHCTPIDYTFHATPHTPVASGTVLWTYDFSRDPDVGSELVRMVGPESSFTLDNATMTIGTDGGPIGMVGPGIVIALTGDGAYRGLHNWGTFAEIGSTRRPNWLAALGPADDLLVADRATTIMSRIGFGRTSTPARLLFDLPAGLATPELRRDSFEQSATVLEDGTVVWTFWRRHIVASCADGRVRWVVEHDFDPDAMVAPQGFALRDGSVLVIQDQWLFHLGGDGTFLGQVRLSLRGSRRAVVEGCGFYEVSTDDGVALTRYDLRTFEPLDRVPLPGYVAVAPNCDVFTLEYRDAALHGTLRRLNADGSPNWSVDLAFPPQSLIVPLIDDGVALAPAYGGSLYACAIGIFERDGTPRPPVDCTADLPARSRTTAVRPDGVLIGGFGEDDPHFVALELGGIPARTAWAFEGTTWAHNGAVWMLPPPSSDVPGF